MKVIKTLGATLLAAGLLASVAPAGASARDFEGYVACSRSAHASEAASCATDFTVFFRSLDATVLFHLCIKAPDNSSDCLEPTRAQRNHLYRQGVTGAPGRYLVTFFVEDHPIGSKRIFLTG